MITPRKSRTHSPGMSDCSELTSCFLLGVCEGAPEASSASTVNRTASMGVVPVIEKRRP